MGDPSGFLKHGRELPQRRPVPVRLRDWKEVYEPFAAEDLRTQASRCMDCGIPFCNDGCPLGNLIPDWNDLIYRDQWHAAIERLHATNNFPEFTGRLCPAPCEAACVLGINSDAVTIKQVEVSIIDRAWEEDWVQPVLADRSSGKSVAVVGSGPAGLAAAQQLTRAGHSVTVFERDDRPGGLLRYGIPEFKMEKRVLDRRLAQMRAEGTQFACNVDVGAGLSVEELRARFDAVVLATGATVPRDLDVPGRALQGIHQAMEYLPPANRVAAGELAESPISAHGKRVVIIGGGDTGADCLGTAHRQGAASVHQFEIMPRPPDSRAETTPWPTWPLMFRTSSAHEEGGERVFAVNTASFLDDGHGAVRALSAHQVEVTTVDGRPRFERVEGTDFELPCELVLLALGFSGPERSLPSALGVTLTARGTVARDKDGATDVDGVFVCGDAGRGQSLIVWAIAEGRSCAAAVDRWLSGSTLLPRPLALS
ncbi:glutamate synthase subunit beta [Acidiferrimicrobium sp. IK]|uniref:glutamate synthase subunit beta n=1 Tax=Acidiferrimicrobium sp. IK TaxID=2871700 RepID=UPI0021CAF3EB|nr:glutamate synthase subunit beta [Acidiferrimicrobium sp. IK]MCU4184579.1 glutamate synthase subunit beta [Acidiferrimicrobium sp. IK]